MPRAKNGNVEIYYESYNDSCPQTVLLVNGLGAQMLRYPVPFCQMLGEKGFRAIRMDNRDTGLSSWPKTAYTLADMAADCIAVLDHAGVKQAHVAGTSMGGMIVQLLAINYPDRILSMVSIMSSTGAPDAMVSTPEAAAILGAPAPDPKKEFDAWLNQAMKSQRVIESPGYPWTDQELRERCTTEVNRAYNPVGVARQRAAIAADGDRTARLAQIRVPTVVLHGAEDPLLRPIGGEATAKAIKGAELRIIPGMGHNMPPALFPVFLDAITSAASRVGSSRM